MQSLYATGWTLRIYCFFTVKHFSQKLFGRLNRRLRARQLLMQLNMF